MIRRKLAEIWEIDGNYHVEIHVSDYHLELTRGNEAQAEMASTYECIEALRKIVQMSDDNNVRLEKELPGP